MSKGFPLSYKKGMRANHFVTIHHPIPILSILPIMFTCPQAINMTGRIDRIDKKVRGC